MTRSKSLNGNLKDMPVESYFLRYAFPCTYILKQKGDIDEKTFRKLENAALENKKVDRKLLENTYKKAFERIKKLAKDMHARDYWSIDIIQEYFHSRHNILIDRGEISFSEHDNLPMAPEVLREICKVMKAEIIEKRDDFFIVKYTSGKNQKTRVVASFFVPDAKTGDLVFIHHGYAVEKVSQEF